MKKVLLFSLLFSISAFATESSQILCKNMKEASSQGYEAIINGQNAVIKYKGKQKAKLTLKAMSKPSGFDMIQIKLFNDAKLKYGLKLKSGGFAGITTAEVLMNTGDGWAIQADLNDCR